MTYYFSESALRQALISRIISSVLACALAVVAVVALSHIEPKAMTEEVWYLAGLLGLTIIYDSICWARFKRSSSITVTGGNLVLPRWIVPGTRFVPAEDILSTRLMSTGRSRILRVNLYHSGPIVLSSDLFEREDALEQMSKALGCADSDQSGRLPLLAISVSLVLFVIFLNTGRYPAITSSGHLIAAGAFYTEVFSTHEYYRLLSYALLHKNFPHLFVNTFLLLVLGRALEGELGTVRFATVFLLGAPVSALGLYASKLQLLVGASGGLYALLATYVCLRLFRGRAFADPFPAVSNMALLLALLIDGIASTYIRDVAIGVHVAGFLVGISCFLFFEFAPGQLHAWFQSLVLGVSGVLLVQAIYAAISWNDQKTLALASYWIHHGSRAEVLTATWMVATSESVGRRDLHAAIERMKEIRRNLDDDDTLATLYARSGNWPKAISLEDGIVSRMPEPAFVSQLARFEDKDRLFLVGHRIHNGKLTVDSPATVDAVCGGGAFERFDVRREVRVSLMCGGAFELLAIRPGLAGNVKVGLDPRVLALPL